MSAAALFVSWRSAVPGWGWSLAELGVGGCLSSTHPRGVDFDLRAGFRASSCPTGRRLAGDSKSFRAATHRPGIALDLSSGVFRGL